MNKLNSITSKESGNLLIWHGLRAQIAACTKFCAFVEGESLNFKKLFWLFMWLNSEGHCPHFQKRLYKAVTDMLMICPIRWESRVSHSTES